MCIACRAMFADIGHFSRPAIQLGFCVVVVSLTEKCSG